MTLFSVALVTCIIGGIALVGLYATFGCKHNDQR